MSNNKEPAQPKISIMRGEAGTSGFLTNSDSDCTVPAVLGQESHASSYLRKGTPLDSRVVRGFQAPRRAVCGTRGSLRTMHGGAPVFLPGESQGLGSLVGCRLWGHTESDTTEVT